MAKKSPQQVVVKDAAPTKPKGSKAPRPRKKPPKAQEPAPSQEAPQPEASSTAIAPPTKAKKNPPKPQIETRELIMYPRLHQNIVDAVSTSMPAPRFQKKHVARDQINYYETYVMGKFQCKNSACSTKGWASRKVFTVIRGYIRNGYNAVVHNQRCRSCNSLGTLRLDDTSYVERVSYRLMKWAGLEVELPFFNPKKSPPHRQELCEGCKRGLCEAGGLRDFPQF